MASPGLLVLLLSSSLLLCSLSASSPSIQQKEHRLQKRGAKTKAALSAADYIVKIMSASKPFIGMIPIVGSYINDITGIAKAVIDATKPDPTQPLLNEFEKLNLKIDSYHVKQKWDTWASAYSDYESDILLASNEFEKLLKVFADKTKDKKKREESVNQFKKTYKKVNLPTKRLHQALIAKGKMFLTNFGELLSKHVKCHEKDIKQFTVLISTLLYKGNTVELYHEKLKGSQGDIETLAQIAYESANVMFNIHKHCISSYLSYVKEDVKDLINDKDQRQQLAKNIRLFLEKAYDRYDWITVAYITKNSSHKKKATALLNKHNVSVDFTEVTKGDITVAVASQLKGSHTKAGKVRQAIEKCFAKKSAECHKVIKQLGACEESVDGIKVKDTYTAVHAFISKSHDSVDAKNAKEAPDEEYIDTDNPSQTPYVYTGRCKKYKVFNTGHFRVLIKSDEEMMGKPPCDKLDCGGAGKGKCVVLDKTLIPVCECEKGHYGNNCEESVEDYKKRLNEKMPEN